MSLSKKLFRDLTDEELIEEAMKAVPDYLEMIRSTGNFDLGACLGKEFGRLESLFKAKHGIRSLFQADPDERAEIDAVEFHLRPILTEKTRDIQQRYLQSRKVSQINGVTAKALIGAAFREAGLQADVTAQRYRARVEVRMPSGHMVRFYISYKKLKEEGVLEGCLEAVQKLMEGLTQLGYGAAIKRV